MRPCGATTNTAFRSDWRLRHGHLMPGRGELDLGEDLCSDTRSVMSALDELARDCSLGIQLSEELIPVLDEARGACELLDLDPLHIPNEDSFLAVVAAG